MRRLDFRAALNSSLQQSEWIVCWHRLDVPKRMPFGKIIGKETKQFIELLLEFIGEDSLARAA